MILLIKSKKDVKLQQLLILYLQKQFKLLLQFLMDQDKILLWKNIEKLCFLIFFCLIMQNLNETWIKKILKKFFIINLKQYYWEILKRSPFFIN